MVGAVLGNLIVNASLGSSSRNTSAMLPSAASTQVKAAFTCGPAVQNDTTSNVISSIITLRGSTEPMHSESASSEVESSGSSSLPYPFGSGPVPPCMCCWMGLR
jgi:hypothetical protein